MHRFLFIDDIIICAKSPQQHFKYRKSSTSFYGAVSLELKLRMYHFLSESEDCLGHAVASGKQ